MWASVLRFTALVPLRTHNRFLPRRLKAGVVSLAFCTQSVCPLEIEATAVNGKPVVHRDGSVFHTSPVFLSIDPVFVVTGTNTALRLSEWAADFLAGTPIVCCFSIIVHRQSCITDQVVRRKRFIFRNP